jgi:hypothetical protein
MNYQCVSARFLFFNGKTNYTVEYHYGIRQWFVFADYKTTDALWSKTIEPAKCKTPTRDSAAEILNEYLESVAVSQ